MRWRVRRQTWAKPVQDGARCSVMLAVTSRQRVSMRPWPFSTVSTCLRSGGGDHSPEGGIRPEGQGNVRFQSRLIVLDGEEVVAAPFGDNTADLALGEDGITRYDDAVERQRLQQFQCCGNLVGLGRHLQLTDHALQGRAERRQQMNARRPRRGTAAQPLAINRHVPGRLFATHPVAEGSFQRADIQPLKQLTPDRRGWNPVAPDTDRLQCLPRQPPPPAYNPQLVASAG